MSVSRSNTKRVWGIVLLAVTTGRSLAQPMPQADKAFVAIMGIPWTASEQKIHAAIPGLNCTVPSQLCLAPDRKVGTVQMTHLSFLFGQGKLQTVMMEFKRRDFRAVKRFLIQRYGQPTVSTLDLGVPELIWTGRAVDLTLEDGEGHDPGGIMFVVVGTGSPSERRKR